MKKKIFQKKQTLNEIYPVEIINAYDFIKEYKVNEINKSNTEFDLTSQNNSYYIKEKGKHYYGKKRRYYSDYC